MAGNAVVFKKGFVSLNGQDISDQVTQVTVALTKEQLETTPISEEFITTIPGLKSGTVSMQANQDFSQGGLDDILFGIFNSDSPVTFVCRPRVESKSVNNPEYSFSVNMNAYSPMEGGQVGQVMTTPIELNSTGAISRSVS